MNPNTDKHGGDESVVASVPLYRSVSMVGRLVAPSASRSASRSASGCASVSSRGREGTTLYSQHSQKEFGNASVDHKDSEDAEDAEDAQDTQESETKTKSEWTPILRPVNFYHIFSRNNVTLVRNELPSALKHLVSMFQASSCHCTYKEDAIYCRSMDECEFVVSFWLQESSSSSSAPSSVLVEVDRVAGDSITFCRAYVPMVLKTIRGEDCSEFRDFHVAPKCREIPAEIPDGIPGLLYPDIPSSVENALDLVGDMLRSDRFDVTRLGLESLALMTDLNTSTKSTVETVSRVLLTGGAEEDCKRSSRNRHIQEYVFSLALTREFALSSGNDHTEQHAGKALLVLSHAVSFGSFEDLTKFVGLAGDLVHGVSLAHSLCNQVQQAAHAPHSAYLASRILAVLARHGLVDFASIHIPSIRKAASIGTCSHAALAQATHDLLSELVVRH